MDYKSAIIKGIQAIQATAGSEEISKEWQTLIDEVENTTEQPKLAIMYFTLREEIAKAMGLTPEPIKVKTPKGVREYHSVSELINENNISG